MLDEPFGIGIILAPEMNKLREMVRPKNGPIPGEVVKVVHDDGNEEVEDEEGANDEEADEVGIGNIGAAPSLFSRVVRCFVTRSVFTERGSRQKQSTRVKLELFNLSSVSSHPGTQSSMISCQASPVADRKRTKNAIVNDWKLLFLRIRIRFTSI